MGTDPIFLIWEIGVRKSGSEPDYVAGPDGRKAASPKATSQPRKDFLSWDELDLSALNLADAALDLHSPGCVGAFVRRSVERVDRLGHMTFVL
jgi:hypothetical protein